VEIKPGQLLVTKTSMDASQIPLDYSDQLRLSIDKRKTLQSLRISRDQVLLVISVPEDTTHFFPGWASTIIAKRIVFLWKDKLCISTSIHAWSEYFDVVQQSGLD